MQFDVAYTDSVSATHSQHYSITLARFIKHFALAGAGFTPTATLLARGLGAVAWYWDFVEPVAHGADRFGEPIPILRDPTLKAHFSNLSGRAIADFLGREIEKSWVTLSYEGVLIQFGLPIDGERPDLLAVNPTRVVALEAKGYTKKHVSAVEMQAHKEGWYSMLTANRQTAVLKLARGIVERSPDDFDSDPDLLNTPGGIIDLTTGAIWSHDPTC